MGDKLILMSINGIYLRGWLKYSFRIKNLFLSKINMHVVNNSKLYFSCYILVFLKEGAFAGTKFTGIFTVFDLK